MSQRNYSEYLLVTKLKRPFFYNNSGVKKALCDIYDNDSLAEVVDTEYYR